MTAQSSPPTSHEAEKSLGEAVSDPIMLTGQLDQYAAEDLRVIALNSLNRLGDVILDLSESTRVHTACLQVFVALQQELKPHGRKVVFSSVDQSLRSIFRDSGTEQLFTFVDGSR